MNGNIPIAGDDFISTSNGFKFGIGINNPTGNEDILSLTIEKSKGDGLPNVHETWQHHLQDNDPVLKCLKDFKANMPVYYANFLDRAHAKLKEITGGGIPDWPENDLAKQLDWMIKYGTSYSAAGFTVTTGK